MRKLNERIPKYTNPSPSAGFIFLKKQCIYLLFLSLWIPRFMHRSVNMESVVNEVALGQVFFKFFSSPYQYHSTVASY
jgi:hypothetical protein